MDSIDKLRSMFQGGGEASHEGKRDVVSSVAVLSGIVLHTISRMATAKWRGKFDFTLEPREAAVAGPTVSVIDVVFKFGKHKFSSLKWVALFKGGYLDWLLNNANMLNNDSDMIDLFRAARSWGEQARNDIPKCFGDDKGETFAGCANCHYHTACITNLPAKMYGHAVTEAKLMIKETGAVRKDVLELNVKGHLPKGRAIDEMLMEAIVNEAVEYASSQKNGGRQ